jgi:methanogenic corrinoid protein MtbC1
MIRWCSYCFSFLGQIEPLDTFQVSHGVCEACLEAGVFDGGTEHDARIADLQGLYGRLRSLQRDPTAAGADVAGICDQALRLGLSRPDILLALLQPALYEVGARFEAGEVHVYEEHAFTRYCERVLVHLERLPGPLPGAPLDALLLNVEGNHHQVGLRVIESLLRDRGLKVLCIVPGMPVQELPLLLKRWRPKVLGLSLSMPEQLPALRAAREQVMSMPASVRPRVIVGGRIFTENKPAGDWSGVRFFDPNLGTRETLVILDQLFPKAVAS